MMSSNGDKSQFFYQELFHIVNTYVPYFFLIGINSIQGWTAITTHEVTRKRSTKRLEHTGNQFRKNLQLKDHC